MGIFRIAWYAFLGGTIATAFQLAEQTFVPVWALVPVATWPPPGAQLLSGRRSGSQRDAVLQLGFNRDTIAADDRERESARNDASPFAGPAE